MFTGQYISWISNSTSTMAGPLYNPRTLMSIVRQTLDMYSTANANRQRHERIAGFITVLHETLTTCRSLLIPHYTMSFIRIVAPYYAKRCLVLGQGMSESSSFALSWTQSLLQVCNQSVVSSVPIPWNVVILRIYCHAHTVTSPTLCLTPGNY